VKRYLDAILAELKADRKKATAFCAVMAVGLLLWGRLLIGDDVPRVATATPDPSAAVAAATGPAAPARRAAPARPATVELRRAGDPPRDLFDFDPSPYKPTPDHAAGQGPAKLPRHPADESPATATVLEQARSLQVQSVVKHGAAPKALINGRLVNVGETIEGFEIVSIRERSVVARKQGVLVRLSM
jgi:hypothetical protein